MRRARSALERLSLRDRVTLASAAALAVGLGILTAGLAILLTHQASTDADVRLTNRADAVRSTLTVREGRLEARDTPDDGALDSGVWIFDTQGVSVERPSAGAAVQRAAHELRATSGRTQRDIGDVRLLAVPASDAAGRRIGTVVVAYSLSPAEHTRDFALLATLIVDAIVLAGGALLSRRAAATALRPVADMTRRAADWSEHDLDRRFALGPPRDELTALSATLDALLARIGASIRHEQRFSAEMAHELRTPLAGVRGEAELALRRDATPSGQRAALERIEESCVRMQAVIDTLLAVARGEADGHRAAGDVREAVATAVGEVQGAAASAGVRLEVGVDAGAARLAGADRELIVRALAPLLDNAVRHARAHVEVRIDGRDRLSVHVHDDGPGVAAGVVAQLFEPGVSTAGHAGAGLGLALARRLARSGGGDVEHLPTASGAGFVLRLPAVG